MKLINWLRLRVRLWRVDRRLRAVYRDIARDVAEHRVFVPHTMRALHLYSDELGELRRFRDRVRDLACKPKYRGSFLGAELLELLADTVARCRK